MDETINTARRIHEIYSAVRCNNEGVKATYHCNLIKRSADNKMRGDVSGQDETKMKLEKRR